MLPMKKMRFLPQPKHIVNKKGWHFNDWPERYFPCKCAGCKKCWYDREAGQCVYGGPFKE